MSKPKRPVLRYHGGKWRLAPWIISHFPKHRIYSEVFGGAASILLRKRRCYSEVYNDLSGDVWNVFRVIRDDREELERVIRATPYSRREYEASKEGEPAADPIERARQTILRSFMGFGSASYLRTHSTGFRPDAKRSGSTPAHDWMRWPDQLGAFEKRLQGVTLENRRAEKVLRKTDNEKTLHYVDPPYVTATRSTKEAAYAYEMTDGDHEDLAALLLELEGMVVLSGYASPLYEDLYTGWRQVRRQALASSQNSSTTRTECLWLNPAAQAAQPQKSLFAASQEVPA